MLVRGVFRHQYVFKFKNVYNWSERGVSIFQISLKFKKVSNIRWGGGQAYLGHCPKFSCFLIMTPPLIKFAEVYIVHVFRSKRVEFQFFNLRTPWGLSKGSRLLAQLTLIFYPNQMKRHRQGIINPIGIHYWTYGI